jgi:Arc/MetJ-type ribon-helix-helix transcriptional regulator
MAKDTLVPKNCRLTRAQVDFIRALEGSGIFGDTESDVMRALLDRAIKELVETEYVKKHRETLTLLGK